MLAIVLKRWLPCLSVLLLSSSLAAGQETPAEKIRKVLDRPITLNFTGQDLQEIAGHLKEKTEINFVIDQAAQFGMNQFPAIGPAGLGFPGAVPAMDLKSENVKLQVALQRFLNAQNLTFVVLENSVLITTEELAITRQLGQRISVRVSDMPLQKALKEITRATPVNMVIDPRVTKDAQNPVTLDLDGITVETAVRLLAEMGGLKSVRIDNVLFVTNEERADKMRKEQPPVTTPSPTMPGWPRGFGGAFGGMGIGVPAIGIAPAGAPFGVPQQKQK